MACPPYVALGDSLPFSIVTHDVASSNLYNADQPPAYSVYSSDFTLVGQGTMSLLSDDDDGFYRGSIPCTTDNGFEEGRVYLIFIKARVAGDVGGISYAFRVDSLMTKLQSISDRIGPWLGTSDDNLLAALRAVFSKSAALPPSIGDSPDPAEVSLEALAEAIAAANVVGAGDIEFWCTIRRTNNDPVADADVWITTDPQGEQVVAGPRRSGVDGRVMFRLQNGAVYYLWASKVGWQGVHGVQFTAHLD